MKIMSNCKGQVSVKFQRAIGYAILFTLIIAPVACVTLQPSVQVIGHWQGDLKGFPLEIVYTETTVGVDGSSPVSYTMSGNVVTLVTEDHRSYRVEFPSRNEMVQIDESTGDRQSFRRTD